MIFEKDKKKQAKVRNVDIVVGIFCVFPSNTKYTKINSNNSLCILTLFSILTSPIRANQPNKDGSDWNETDCPQSGTCAIKPVIYNLAISRINVAIVNGEPLEVVPCDVQ